MSLPKLLYGYLILFDFVILTTVLWR